MKKNHQLHIDEDGNLNLSDRRKFLIKPKGYQV